MAIRDRDEPIEIYPLHWNVLDSFDTGCWAITYLRREVSRFIANESSSQGRHADRRAGAWLQEVEQICDPEALALTIGRTNCASLEEDPIIRECSGHGRSEIILIQKVWASGQRSVRRRSTCHQTPLGPHLRGAESSTCFCQRSLQSGLPWARRKPPSIPTVSGPSGGESRSQSRATFRFIATGCPGTGGSWAARESSRIAAVGGESAYTGSARGGCASTGRNAWVKWHLLSTSANRFSIRTRGRRVWTRCLWFGSGS
jgi:hypothetical protein